MSLFRTEEVQIFYLAGRTMIGVLTARVRSTQQPKTSANRYNAFCAPVAQLDRAYAFEQRRQKF